MKTVSLELAKKLKEAGYPQESQFKYCGGHTFYYDDDKGAFEECDGTDLLGEDEYCHTAGLTCEFLITSPTVDEILDQLPMPIDRGGGRMHRLWINREPVEDKIELIYVNARNSDDYFLVVADSIADAAAKMWLCLKERGLLEVSHKDDL